MKILHLSESDKYGGGAAIATHRLHTALLAKKVDSKMLVQTKLTDDKNVISSNSKFRKLINYAVRGLDRIYISKKLKTQVPFSAVNFPFKNLIEKIDEINPDLVHLHWINAAMISISDLSKIKVPIVWTLQDSWAFTGGCHIPKNCRKFEENCGNCPYLQSEKENDLSRHIYNSKLNTFRKIKNLTIIGVSDWMMTNIKSSSLLGDRPIVKIPNSTDTKVYKKLDKEHCRKLWNLPSDKRLVLFGAINAVNDENKGGEFLNKALNNLDEKDVLLVVFGSSAPNENFKLNIEARYVGHLNDAVSLVSLYNACDVMVVPSKQESFGLTALEALACGTPVAAFNTTGLRDIVTHKEDGYLAEPFDTNDLTKGIKWILNNQNYQDLSIKATTNAPKKFSTEVVADQFIELYKNILQNNK